MVNRPLAQKVEFSKKSSQTTSPVTIAIDAMGGDHAPNVVITGAALALEEGYNINYKIYGDKARVVPLLSKFPHLIDRSELIHCSQVVSADEKPTDALRYFKDSSMQQAINAVKNNEASAVVSAGNTGALMAMSVITLKMLALIHRPAIVTLMPNMKGRVVVLDLGANVESDANNLYQFAIMGEIFARIVLNKERPTVGLLNIGSEATKGKDSIKLAYSMLKETKLPIKFYGYVEGDDIASGLVDVVVTDGFTGNVVLKAVQGYAKVFKQITAQSFRDSILARIQYLFARSVLKKIGSNLDNRKYNGAMLIGVNGIVVKSHGSTDQVGICSAIKVAHALVCAKINEHIAGELATTGNIEST